MKKIPTTASTSHSVLYIATIAALVIFSTQISSFSVAKAQETNSANSGNTIHICHVPSNNIEKARILEVNENGLNGHDVHASDFIVTNLADEARCNGIVFPPPTTDVCSNISGDQANIPLGMILVDGICVFNTNDGGDGSVNNGSLSDLTTHDGGDGSVTNGSLSHLPTNDGGDGSMTNGSLSNLPTNDGGDGSVNNGSLSNLPINDGGNGAVNNGSLSNLNTNDGGDGSNTGGNGGNGGGGDNGGGLGGGDDSSTPSTGGGGNSGGGSGGGNGSSARNGSVLGASASCGIYLESYLRQNQTNSTEQVIKLQAFLNEYVGSDLPLTGFYGPMTEVVVNQFQLKYNHEVLKPWADIGLLPNENTPTGYVYKTTRRMINNIVCPELNLPIPQLP